jgi:predicted HTH transcriptional regulator
MDILELLDIIKKGENSFTEFKRDFSNLDNITEEICTFSNAKGGRIVVGVSDGGEILGVENDRSDEISQMAYTKIEPGIQIGIDKIYYDKRLICVLTIRLGTQKPYGVRHKGHKDYWIRSGSTKKKASREELLRLFQESGSIHIDELPVPDTTLDDFNMEFFAHFFEKNFERSIKEELEMSQISLEKLLENMKIVKNKNLTLAGLLLFGRNPQQFKPFCIMWAIRIFGTDFTAVEFANRKEISGTLAEQLDKIENFFKDHLRRPAVIKGFDRKDYFEIPIEALREAVVSAVAHRDYSMPSNIRVFIYDDRIEVLNPGKLPNTVTIENIKYGIHVERNPIIVSYLTKLGKVSQIGTGIPRLIQMVRKSTGKTPFLKR